MLSLVVDGALAILLLTALGLGLRLLRSLRQLRSDDNEIERLIAALDAATRRAANALDALRQTAEAAAQRLAGERAGAQRVLDDLQFLTSRGDQLADRLEEQIRKGRPAAPRSSPAVAAAVPPAGARAADRTADLERALRTLR
jgi:ABC-type transporter Mla subunit MlaD